MGPPSYLGYSPGAPTRPICGDMGRQSLAPLREDSSGQNFKRDYLKTTFFAQLAGKWSKMVENDRKLDFPKSVQYLQKSGPEGPRGSDKGSNRNFYSANDAQRAEPA